MTWALGTARRETDRLADADRHRAALAHAVRSEQVTLLERRYDEERARGGAERTRYETLLRAELRRRWNAADRLAHRCGAVTDFQWTATGFPHPASRSDGIQAWTDFARVLTCLFEDPDAAALLADTRGLYVCLFAPDGNGLLTLNDLARTALVRTGWPPMQIERRALETALGAIELKSADR
jgi:hypothetical protein